MRSLSHPQLVLGISIRNIISTPFTFETNQIFKILKVETKFECVHRQFIDILIKIGKAVCHIVQLSVLWAYNYRKLMSCVQLQMETYSRKLIQHGQN